MMRTFVILIFLLSGQANSKDQASSNIFLHSLPFAELSNAIYGNQRVIQNIAKQYGLSLNEVKNIADIEVSYALLSDLLLKKHIIVVRGTANAENALVDMDIKMVIDKQTGVFAHQGFLSGTTLIFQDLKSKLDKKFSVSVSGHSLGGAIAVLLAMQLQSDGVIIDNVITFGQPKVTNLSGATKYQNLNVTRFVQSKDLVPVVPPIDSLDIQNFNIYWHLGREIILLGNNKYAELEGVSSMLRGADFVTSVLSMDNLKDHEMPGYLALIRRNSEFSRKVEYRTSFSFKNIFGEK